MSNTDPRHKVNPHLRIDAFNDDLFDLDRKWDKRFKLLETTVIEMPLVIQKELQQMRAALIVNEGGGGLPRKEPKTSIGRWFREAKETILIVSAIGTLIGSVVSGYIHATGPSAAQVVALQGAQQLIQARLQVVETATTGKAGEIKAAEYRK